MPKAQRRDVNAKVNIVAENLFTDREEPRKAFWKLYNEMEPGDYEVITYYGIGGIGKTTLLRQIGKEMDETIPEGKLDHAFFSFEGKASKEEFLFNLSRQMMLSNKGLMFTMFDTAIRKMAAQEGKDLSQFEAKAKASFVDNPLVAAALDVGDTLLSGVGLLGSATKIVEQLVNVSEKKKEEKYLTEGEFAVDYYRIQDSSSDEIRRSLQDFFLDDVYDIFAQRQRPYVIFLDGYENMVSILSDGDMAQTTDNWLSALDGGLVNIPNVLWVVAGREKINWDPELLPEDHCHRVGDLSLEDSASFFEKAGVPKELWKPLYDLTGGTPAFMDLCVETYRTISRTGEAKISDFGKNTDELAHRYLRDMDKDDQKLMIMLSCFPNEWDIGMAEAVSNRLGYKTARLSDLLKLSLFERVSSGYRLHETFRSITRRFSQDSENIRINDSIYLYLKTRVLEAKETDYRLDMIQKLCEFLDSYEPGKSILGDDNDGIADARSAVTCDMCNDMSEVVAIARDEVILSGEYFLGEIIFSKLLRFIVNEDLSPQTRVVAENARNYNYYSLGQYEKMLYLTEETAEYVAKMLDPDDVCAIKAHQELATAKTSLGYHKEALEIMRDVCDRFVKILGEDDKTTLSAQSNLGVILTSNGFYKEALALSETVLEKRKVVMGPDHPETLRTMGNLGSLYVRMGKNEEAKKIRSLVYEKRKSILGENHPLTITAHKALAGDYSKTGNHEEALSIFRQVYEKRKERLGVLHPRVIRDKLSISSELGYLKEYEEALKIVNEAYDDAIISVGEKHPLIATVLESRAICYGFLGRHQDCLEDRREALKIRREVLGDDNPDTLIAWKSFGLEFYKFRKYEKALAIFKEVYLKEVRIIGPDNPQTKRTAELIVMTRNKLDYNNLGDYNETASDIRN